MMLQAEQLCDVMQAGVCVCCLEQVGLQPVLLLLQGGRAAGWERSREARPLPGQGGQDEPARRSASSAPGIPQPSKPWSITNNSQSRFVFPLFPLASLPENKDLNPRAGVHMLCVGWFGAHRNGEGICHQHFAARAHFSRQIAQGLK